MTIRALGDDTVVEFDGRDVTVERRGQNWSRQPATVSFPIESVLGYNATAPGRDGGAFQLVLDASAAEYAPSPVTYPPFRARDFARLAQEITVALERRGRAPVVSLIAMPATPAPEPAARQLPPGRAQERDVAAQLADLAGQYRDGLLSPAEFSTAKALVLGLERPEPTDRAA